MTKVLLVPLVIWVALLSFMLPSINSMRSSGPYGRQKAKHTYHNNDDDFSIDYDLLKNHQLDNYNSKRNRRVSANSRQGLADYDYRYTRRTDSYGGGLSSSSYGGTGSHSGSSGYGGGGYGGGSKMGGIDLYSILALGIFAIFLGYVVFYYISVNGGGRAFDSAPVMLTEDMNQLLYNVWDAIERWAVLDFLAKTTEKESTHETELLKKNFKIT